MKLFDDLNHSIDVTVQLEPKINLDFVTDKSFFYFNENELMNYLNSYPFYNTADLLPSDTTGFDFITLEKYRYQKMAELLPEYLFFNVHGFYIEHLAYLNSFLNLNFGSYKYLLRVADTYYDLDTKEFVELLYLEAGTYKIIENHRITKELFTSSGFDSNGYEINTYYLKIEFDISQFLDFIGDISSIPVVPMPSYSEEQLQLLPPDYSDLLEKYKHYHMFSNDSKYLNQLIEYYPFKNPLKIQFSKSGFSYLRPVSGFIDFQVFGAVTKIELGDFYGTDTRYKFELGQLWGSTWNRNLEKQLYTYNFFNPFEWFFIAPDEVSYKAQCRYNIGGELQCKSQPEAYSTKYIVYRFRGFNYDKFEDYSNAINNDGSPNEPTNKKCCLFDIFKTK